MSKDAKGRGCLSVAGLFGLFALVAWVLDDCSGSGSGKVATPVVQLPTRAEWAAKAAGAGPNGQMVALGKLVIGRDALFRAVGQPSSSEDVGNDVHLYWKCADGTVQVVTQRAFFNVQGVIAGQINNF
jgi:hypothetical protein